MNPDILFNQLKNKYGPQNWWPILVSGNQSNRHRTQHGLTYGISHKSLVKYANEFRDPYFEIAIGAILTQNVSWKNVAKSISNLYDLKSLKPNKILKLDRNLLETALIPSRYYKQKTKSLTNFSKWLVKEFNGDILKLKKYPSSEIRLMLLDQWGVGKETADSIMLYSLNLPIFVVDIYTKKILKMNGLSYKNYDDYRMYFEDYYKDNTSSRKKVKLFQEFHALLVAEGQNCSLKLRGLTPTNLNDKLVRI